MGKAISMKLRYNIINQHNDGKSKSAIARDLKVNRTTVHQIIKNYETDGDLGLKTHYQNCGKQSPSKNDFGYRAVCLLKQWHPTWGAERIRAEIGHKRPAYVQKNLRTIQRWLAKIKPKEPKSVLPKEPKQWAKLPNEGWQIDAKEEIELGCKKNAVG